MSKVLWIKGGHVIDPVQQRDGKGDLFVVDGVFVKSLSAAEKKAAKVIQAKGLVVCPGFVDIHTHLREPGDTAKETIASGTLAAAAGGFTTVVCMPNTKPPADNAGTIQLIRDAVARTAKVNVFPMGCITAGREGERLAPIGSLARAGVVAVSDGGHCIQNAEIMRRAVEYAAMFGLPVIDHCQDANLTEGCVMHEGDISLRLGLRGMSRMAEDVMVARDAIMAEQTGAHLHLQHIASASALDIIAWSRKRKARLTAEVTPHHLALTHEALVEYDTNLKMLPPLRTEKDRQALIKGLRKGVIDCIATAHAPHTVMEKDREFDYAPFGINGLETAFSVCYRALVEAGHASLSELIGWLAHKPSELLNLGRGTLEPGRPADFILLDHKAEWEVTAAGFRSLSSNSPWLGDTLPGKVHATYVGGAEVYNDA